MQEKKPISKKSFITFILPAPVLFFIILFTGTVNAQNGLDVISNSWMIHSDASNSLYHHLAAECLDHIDKREEEISKLNSLAAWQERQKFIRETLMDIVGPFPEKTPLNARTIRTIDKGSYRVEHVIYESLPGFYVTSSLYIPAGLKRRDRAPAIIYCSGHAEEGYRSRVYQHVILNLVTKGFIVFAFDPVGQGERLEYFDPATGRSSVGGPTKEHSYPGAQAFITGASQARYMIWDGIRAVDYLVSRREVDPSRIGITGRSGGGTQSAYIAAFDERVLAAAPENYLTSYRRLLQSIGPQDAEQVMFHFLQRGLDHADLLLVRAPKPAMMITTTRDMFSIQGSMETEKEVAEIYRMYGEEENFSRIEDDDGHASTKKNREAMYAFFRENLKHPGSTDDEKISPLSAEELRVTQTGQLSTSLEGETVFSLNRKEAEIRLKELNEARRNPDIFYDGIVESAKRMSGFREPSTDDLPVFTGRIIRDYYNIEKYFIKGEGDYVIPYLLFRPVVWNNRGVFYLNPDGKSAGAGSGGDIERFLRQGFAVMAPDMIGCGENGPGIFRGDAYFDGTSHNLWYASLLAGRSITGIHTGDVVKLIRVLRKECPYADLIGFARKEMASVLLHTAVIDRNITTVILAGPYSSFRSIVMNRSYDTKFILSTIPAGLTAYDLPDLAAALAPRRLFIAGMTDGNGTETDITEDISIIRNVYSSRNAGDRLRIEADLSALESWIE
ncbi:MAG: prolyl oligopeptidase family serine peptidase [Bacteroidales bacterium]|jgi:hypothetical protein|nr:prolyl oligopeptidase family serine peptidase [Bacteroidales bacterium]